MWFTVEDQHFSKYTLMEMVFLQQQWRLELKILDCSLLEELPPPMPCVLLAASVKKQGKIRC
jgi:hypothetical protein